MKLTVLNLITRKMVAFYLSWFSVFWLTLTGKLSGDNFLIIAPTILVILVGGNVWAKKFLPDTTIPDITIK